MTGTQYETPRPKLKRGRIECISTMLRFAPVEAHKKIQLRPQPFIATFLGLASSDFGSTTERTPFVYSAATSFSVTLHGRVTVLVKLPDERSMR